MGGCPPQTLLWAELRKHLTPKNASSTTSQKGVSKKRSLNVEKKVAPGTKDVENQMVEEGGVKERLGSAQRQTSVLTDNFSRVNRLGRRNMRRNAGDSKGDEVDNDRESPGGVPRS